MSKDKISSAYRLALAILDSLKMLAAWVLELVSIVGAILMAATAVSLVMNAHYHDAILSALIGGILLLFVMLLSLTTGQSKGKVK